MDFESPHLDITVDGDVVTITLDNPDQRNALGREVMEHVTAGVRAVGQTSALGIIIAANGPVFSAGHNFGDMRGATLDEAQSLLDTCTEMMNSVQEASQVVIAKVHALATAAGCQLVASCDLAVAADSAGFCLPGGKGGLFCHTPLVAVARQIGRKRALEMSLTGDVISASVAADWGLINQVVPDDQLDGAVLYLMQRATRGSASSKALGKRAFYAQVDMDQPKAYDYAMQVMSAGVTTADGQEGIVSFLEKRPPNWQPR